MNSTNSTVQQYKNTENHITPIDARWQVINKKNMKTIRKVQNTDISNLRIYYTHILRKFLFPP